MLFAFINFQNLHSLVVNHGNFVAANCREKGRLHTTSTPRHTITSKLYLDRITDCLEIMALHGFIAQFYSVSITVTVSLDIWNKTQDLLDHKVLDTSSGYQRSKNCCSPVNTATGRCASLLRQLIAKSLGKLGL